MDAFRSSGINSQNRGCVLLYIIPNFYLQVATFTKQRVVFPLNLMYVIMVKLGLSCILDARIRTRHYTRTHFW